MEGGVGWREAGGSKRSRGAGLAAAGCSQHDRGGRVRSTAAPPPSPGPPWPPSPPLTLLSPACRSSSALMMEKPTGPRVLVRVRLRVCPPSCTLPLSSMPCDSSHPTASWLSPCGKTQRGWHAALGCAPSLSGRWGRCDPAAMRSRAGWQAGGQAGCSA